MLKVPLTQSKGVVWIAIIFVDLIVRSFLKRMDFYNDRS